MEESFLVAIGFVIEVQLKGLTHMFCFLMPFYKVYKECAFSLDFTLEIMCDLVWTQRSLTLKSKYKIK